MTDFITIYQQRQGVRQQIKKLRSKIDWKEFVRLKEQEKELSEKLTKIIDNG